MIILVRPGIKPILRHRWGTFGWAWCLNSLDLTLLVKFILILFPGRFVGVGLSVMSRWQNHGGGEKLGWDAAGCLVI